MKFALKFRTPLPIACAVVLLSAPQACSTPPRIPLGAPLPVVQGGTPVPGDGLGLSLELHDGLQGQELLRKELLAGSISAGFLDRFVLSVGGYGGHEESDEPTGIVVSGKARLGPLLGDRTSTAVRLSYAHIDRVNVTDGGGQNESLVTLDLAVPTERLFSEPTGSVRFSGYAGPRFLYESYRDELVPEDDFSGVIPGLLAGLHLDFGAFHVFAEGTYAWRPGTTVRGVDFDGGGIFMPAIGVVLRSGDPFPWD